MSGVEIRQKAASEGQRGGRKGQEGWPSPLHRASWSTAEKGVNSKRKEFAPKFFPFRVGPFSEGDCCRRKQTGSHKSCLRCQKWQVTVP